MKRIVIVGGGIIGLSIAFELSTRAAGSVVLLEEGELGRQASWAGAGMLPPANSNTAIHPIEHLAALSNQLHPKWSKRLAEITGIDNAYRKSGSLHVASTAGEVASLFGLIDEWQTQEIDFEKVQEGELRKRFPFVHHAFGDSRSLAVFTKDAAQFDNRRHLEALIDACRKQSVEMHSGVEQIEWEVSSGSSVSRGGEVASIRIDGKELCQEIAADQFVIAAGPWSQVLAMKLGAALPMQPVRGQMVGYQLDATDPDHRAFLDGPIINEGSRYLVTRSDGRVIAGSTIEETGFECFTTEEEVSGLRRWAEHLIPSLGKSHFVDAWAGLRPATYDGFPYLGRLPGVENVWVATGHFKSGLQLSTGTSVVMADLVTGQTPSIELERFCPSRVNI